MKSWRGPHIGPKMPKTNCFNQCSTLKRGTSEFTSRTKMSKLRSSEAKMMFAQAASRQKPTSERSSVVFTAHEGTVHRDRA